MFHCLLRSCLVLVIIITVTVLTGSFSQEIVQFPENVTILLGENGTFHCNSNMATTIWRLTNGSDPSHIQDLDTDRLTRSILEQLARNNIFLSMTQIEDDYNSTLTITGDISKNFTKIQCAIAPADIQNLDFTLNAAAFLAVLGPPTSVTGLQASPPGSNVFLSWAPSFSAFSASVTYHVKVQDEEDGELLHSSNTPTTSFVYTPSVGYCSILLFSVYAYNRAGRTDESILNYTLLTEPNAEVVISSLHHNIELLDGELNVDIEFDTPSGCIAFPVTQYELLLDEIVPGQSTISVGPSTSHKFSLNTSHVRENARYKYRVRAINTINLSDETDPREFILTDVQMPMIVVTSTSVMIRCSFIPGSLSRGCILKLVIGGIPQTRSIERPDGANSVEKLIEIADGINKQESLAFTVFDWEQDGTVGSLPIHVDIMDMRGNADTTTAGLITLPTQGLTTESFQYLTVTIAVSVTVLAMALLIPILTVCCCIVYKCRHKTRKEQAPVTDKVLCSTVEFSQPMSGPVPYEVYPAPRRSNRMEFPDGSDRDRATPLRETYSQLDYCKGCDEGQSCLYSQLNYSMSSLPSGSAIVMNPLSNHPMTIVNYPRMNSLGPHIRHASHDVPYAHSEPRDYSILENISSTSRSPRPPYHMPPMPFSPPDYSEIDALHNRAPSPAHSTSTTV